MPSVLEQLSTAIILLDLKGRFSYLNQSAEQALNITARNLIGQRYSYFIDSNSLPIRQWLDDLSKPETTLFDNRLIQLNNGQQFEAELCLKKIEYDGSEKLLIEWQPSEIIGKHKQDLELQRHSHINRNLLQNLAHEIKTPLSGIAGAAQLLAMSEDDGHSSFSDIIGKEVHRLTGLVDRMLLGQKVASRININIHEVLEQVIEFLRLNLPPNIQIIRDYDPSIPEVTIAPEQIYQVFLNLAQNAIEALQTTIRSEEELKLQFKTRISKQHPLLELPNSQALQVSFIDNGPGIPKELQPSIFYPMISGKNSTGLGLGIAQSLMQQHEGLIEFESSESQTCFSCYLPLPSSGAPLVKGVA